MRVTVTPYNPLWPQIFSTISSSLTYHLSSIPIIAIEHVGSTSVPGLAAKPIIDIDIIIAASTTETVLPVIIKNLTQVGGYEYMGERGVPGRHAFKFKSAHKSQDGELEPSRNVYVCIDGSLGLRNHLVVRDVLRRDTHLREEYTAVKKELAAREVKDIEEYVQGKNEILRKILVAGGLEDDNLREIGLVNTFR